MLRSCARVVAAAVLAAAAYAATPAPPASAAGCSTAHGVTVVVDFHELGGGVQTGCVADGAGDTAASLVTAAGFSLSYVQRQPGFVCRVDGVPADDPCVNTPPSNAYWALFWSDGKSGSWSYSSTSAGGLRVPEGGYVAFSWNGSSSRVTPGYAPAPHPSATPTPSPSPTHGSGPSSHPSQHHSATPSSAPTAASESPTESASAEPTKKPRGEKRSRSSRPSPSAEPQTGTSTETADPSDAAPTAAEPTDPDDGGLPPWVAPAVIVVLFGGAAAAAVARRRRGVPGA